MLEDKKGRFKVTIEVEVNKELKDVMKDAMSKMRWKMPEIMHQGEEK
jgi:hypothetical protein